MTKRNFLVVGILLCLVSQLFGQFEVKKIQGKNIDSDKEGIIYNLPRTGIKVDITIKKTQKIKGPFAEFAEKYLGLNQVVTVNSTDFEISSIQLSAFNEPDPGEMYFLELSEKVKDREAMELQLSAMGSLVGVVSAGKSSADLRKNSFIDSKTLRIPEMPNPAMFEQVDTVIRKISVDTVTIEQKVLRKISAAKTADQKAREAADFILKLDESMFNLVNGYQEVNYEKGTIEFMYQQMANLKNDYLQLFIGITGTFTDSYSFTYFPAAETEASPVTLCKFSISKGILDRNVNAGDLVQLELKNQDLLKEIRTFTSSRNNNPEVPKGIYYRIPEQARVAVKVGGLVKVEAQFPVNQFGAVTFLPPSSNQNLQLHDNTGEIKHVILK